MTAHCTLDWGNDTTLFDMVNQSKNSILSESLITTFYG